MVSVNGTSIALTRGDSLFLKVKLTNKNGSVYKPAVGDQLRFAMKKTYGDTELLINKQIPIDSMVLELEPSDTKPLAFSKYVYDIELTSADGVVSTPIVGNLLLTEEVC